MYRYGLVVRGRVAPGGSKTPGKRKDGTLYTRDASKYTKRWKQAIIAAVEKTPPPRKLAKGEAVSLTLVFHLPRPKSHYDSKGQVRYDKPGVRVHTQKPDTTKLQRAVEDALTKAGVWHDDSAVVEVHSAKHWWSGDNPQEGMVVVLVKLWEEIERERLDAEGAQQ